MKDQLDQSAKTKSRAKIGNAIVPPEISIDQAQKKQDWGVKSSGIGAAPRAVKALDGAPTTDKQFFITTLTGKTVTLDFSPEMTIGDVKAKIREKEQIGGPFNLKFGGKSLQDNHKLSDVGIVKESTLHMTLSLKGGLGGLRGNLFNRGGNADGNARRNQRANIRANPPANQGLG
ncbi:MAG: ubiquitin-like protein, partial [Myxococcota bacterium]